MSPPELLYEQEREIGRLKSTIARLTAGEDVPEDMDARVMLEQWRAAGKMYLAAKDLLPRMHQLNVDGVPVQVLTQLKLAEDELIEAMDRYANAYHT